MFNIGVEEAQELICLHTRPGEMEKVSLYKALNRTAFVDLYAEKDLPFAKQAAQDGFAVAEIRGEGSSYKITRLLKKEGFLGKDEALPVETGQLLPDNSTAVIPLEDAEMDGGFIKLKRAAKLNNFIKMPGEDFKKGEKILSRGEILNPGRISLLAAYGYKEVSVYKKPKAALITLNPYINSPFHNITDSNSYMLAALVESEGGEVCRVEHVGFRPWTELEILLKKLKRESNIVIATGATFGGRNQEFASFIRQKGGKILFSGVRMQPGGHNGAVIFDGLLFLSLSGNPAACAVGFHLLAAPFLRLYQGKSPQMARVKARAANDFSLSARGSQRFLRGYFYLEGEHKVKILPGQKPGMIRSLIDYNCLVEVPPDIKEIKAGMLLDLIVI